MTLGIYCGAKAWSILVYAHILSPFLPLQHNICYRLDQLAVLNKPVTAWLSVQVGLDLLLCGEPLRVLVITLALTIII